MSVDVIAEKITEMGSHICLAKIKGTYHNEQMITDLYSFDELGRTLISSTGLEKYDKILEEVIAELEGAIYNARLVKNEINKLMEE